uniref:S-adenosyl-L-methionine:benzoic acid/salicylic acid carboxyl methyltransferase 3-like n=1 Tax=Erigeron canadensis TaxID=72917 RepID=UPI001CB8D0FF|nr:S-adenosyl-L-methionine:benzoic acid/salicylic acid carboxyl methyltransferase 3-like [Erigeron canadensis]
MDLVKFFHMNGGVGDASYLNNSGLQRMGIMKTRRIIEEAISNLCKSNIIKYPKTLVMADLGCSLGPNTLLVGSMVIDEVAKTSQEMGLNPPEVQINLNDLPTNDFNTIFCALHEREKKLNTEKITDVHYSPPSCYFTGVPGSYFGRLFPAESLNFVHSSYSLHWLSQLPKLREINKGNVYLASTTPESVSKAYYEQFQADFLQFLRCRSEEMMVGGRMVLTFAGRTTEDPRGEESYYYLWRPLAMALQEMVSEGLVDEVKLDSFNLPWFTASPTEIMKLVEIEGSFTIDHIEIFDVNWEAWKTKKYDNDNDNDASTDDNGVGHAVAKSVRAGIETLVANHLVKQ